jgi:hydrogenase maturation protein HypF
VVDPAAAIRALVEELRRGVPTALLSARFHNTLACAAAEVCALLRNAGEPNRVVLSGGVFQNRYLTERCAALLRRAGFEVLTHSLVPPNDGGLALGQALVAGLTAGE